MKVAIRADSSREIGTGHVVRCRTLAAALRARGCDVTFICRAHDGDISKVLDHDGFTVRQLPAPRAPYFGADLYARWRGVEEEADARETLDALAGGMDWLVVDHYGLSATWERRLRGAAKKILAIDDLGRAHDADILFDQNFSLNSQERYAGRLPPACKLLLGPRFALVQPEYSELRAARPRRLEKVTRVLVFFGGVDATDMTGRAIEALRDPPFHILQVDAAVGEVNPHLEKLRRLVRERHNTSLHVGLPSLASLTSTADVALGAGGGATWERCCLGVPTLVVTTGENQVPASRDLDAAGVVRYLGAQETVEQSDLRDALLELIENPARREAMTDQSLTLVDGLGAGRVAEALAPSRAESLTLRVATAIDCGFYFHLVNDVDVRRQSFSQVPVTWDVHKRWFGSRLNAASFRLYVLEVRGLPVGQIRFDFVDGTAVLNYSLDPIVRGRGWGGQLVRLGLARLAAEAPADVCAEVRSDNPVSRLVFDRLGFKCDLAEDRYRYSLTREELISRFAPAGLKHL